jgi:hypothetical protein
MTPRPSAVVAALTSNKLIIFLFLLDTATQALFIHIYMNIIGITLLKILIEDAKILKISMLKKLLSKEVFFFFFVKLIFSITPNIRKYEYLILSLLSVVLNMFSNKVSLNSFFFF